jgi:ferredoxin
VKVYVDQDLCISCGVCIDLSPDVFGWNDDDKAQSIDAEIPGDKKEEVQEAMDSCPTDAIKED